MAARSRGRPRAPRVSAQEILEGHSAEVRALVERLRRLVLEAIPTALEVSYPGWHGIGYHHPDTGYFCALFPRSDAVQLGFEFGVLLPDPDGLLQGVGKQVRYVIVKSMEDIPIEAIQRLLGAAAALPHERGAKLLLAKSGSRPARGQPWPSASRAGDRPALLAGKGVHAIVCDKQPSNPSKEKALCVLYESTPPPRAAEWCWRRPLSRSLALARSSSASLPLE